MSLRELIDRIGLANAIVGALAAGFAVLIIGSGFEFDINEMLEIIVTIGLVTAALGFAAALPYFVSRVLDRLSLMTRD
jgi:hypothetical protein